MTYKQVWHATLQMGKRDELVRVLRESVIPGLRQDPDFIGCRLFLRRFGADFGCQIEFEYRTLEGVNRPIFDSDANKLLVPAVVSLLTSNRAELLIEVDL